MKMKEWREIARNIIIALFTPFRILFNRFRINLNSAYDDTRELAYRVGTIANTPNESSRNTKLHYSHIDRLIACTLPILIIILPMVDCAVLWGLRLYKWSTLTHFAFRMVADITLWLIIYPAFFCMLPALYIEGSREARKVTRVFTIFSFALLLQQLAYSSLDVILHSSWVMQQHTVLTFVESIYTLVTWILRTSFYASLMVSAVITILRFFRRTSKV